MTLYSQLLIINMHHFKAKTQILMTGTFARWRYPCMNVRAVPLFFFFFFEKCHMPLILGVGYTEHFFRKVFRFLTFIFFSFTYHIGITNPKNFLKNINLKKSPGHFTEWCWEQSNFLFQPPMKYTSCYLK